MTETRFGPVLTEEGVRLRLWAPSVSKVSAVVEQDMLSMTPAGGGWYEALVPGAGLGLTYAFEADGVRFPDPASRCQEADVHGPSVVVDHAAYAWRHDDWRGRPWEEAVVVEVHVGAATPEGTFDALRGKLAHYASLGATAIELLPLADFPGARNWGYDGVLPFAPDRSYGAPDDLKRLVDEAHGFGLQMFVDVVYNHFGPDGNYLGHYAKEFFDEGQETPWGAALDFGREEVRDFFTESAAAWLRDYRFDGIRFDAVHMMRDPRGPGHRFLEEMAADLRAAVPDRQVHLILENDDNRSSLLRGLAGERAYDAQWNDDFHHALHRLVTGEAQGYYEDYDAPLDRLQRLLTEGFAYQGEPSPHRSGAVRGTPSADLPPQRFVSFLQNHDQVGNRALGDRIDAVAPEAAVVAATALYLLGPQIPMIWMGEEGAATAPFPFFCDFGGELADAVREGRRREFAQIAEFGTAAGREAIPDPNAPETFALAKLDWTEPESGPHAARLRLFRQLISLRAGHVVPLLRSGAPTVEAERTGTCLTVRYAFPRGTLTLTMNLAAEAAGAAGAAERPGNGLFETHAVAPGDDVPPWYFGAWRS